jgi:hypothetical protein
MREGVLCHSKWTPGYCSDGLAAFTKMIDGMMVRNLLWLILFTLASEKIYKSFGSNAPMAP